MSVNHRLVVYGTLAPGQPNHHRLDGLAGTWVAGTVKGRFVSRGWAAALGYPALALDQKGDDINVHVFLSPDLPAHWAGLDAFEGAQYRRVPVDVRTVDSVITGWIYEAAD